MVKCACTGCDTEACFATPSNVSVCSAVCLFMVHSSDWAARSGSAGKRPDVIVPVKLVNVHDGDTVVDTHKISYRLVGIDTPELAQPGGYEARDALKVLVKGAKFLGIRGTTKDKYNRILGTLYSAGDAAFTKDLVSINDRMVEQGWAWSYDRASPKSGTDLLALERDARADKRGIWAMKGVEHMLPHDYRKAKREGTLPVSFVAVKPRKE